MRLPKKMGGSTRTAREWNQMVDCLAAIQTKPGVDTLTSQTTRGTFISATPAKARATTTGDDNLVWL